MNTNKIEKRITSQLRIGHYLELLTLGPIKLPGSTQGKVKKMKTVKMCLKM